MQQSNYSYNVTISRFDEEGNQDILVDRDISPHRAIEEMVRNQELTSDDEQRTAEVLDQVNQMDEEEGEKVDEAEEDGETTSDDDKEIEEPEEEGKDEVQEPATSGGRTADWDQDQATELIKAGELKPKEIADKVGTTVNCIYQLKYRLKQDGELGDRPAEPAPKRGQTVTEEPEEGPSDEELQEEENKPEPTVTIDPGEDDKTKKLKALFRRLPQNEKRLVRDFQEGEGVSGLFTKYPEIGVARINDLINAYGQVKLD